MTTIQDVPLRLIDIGTNVRIDPGEIADLAASIRELGVLQPVKVTDRGNGRYSLIFGQRRVLASREAALKTIPAMVVPPDDGLGDKGARRAAEQLTENLQRQSLNQIEEAIALRSVLDGHKGLTQAALAQQLGRSGFWISRRLALLELHPSVQQALRIGGIVPDVAYALTKLPLPRQRRMLAKMTRDGGWSAVRVEREVARALNPPPKRPSRGRPRIIELPTPDQPSRSVAIPVRTPKGLAVVTIGIEGRDYIDLVVEDGDGHRVMLSLKATDARLIGRRLGQAYAAVAS